MCNASYLSLNTDDENGAFNGMSHGHVAGAAHLSPSACRVPQRPQITFIDRDNNPLPVTLKMPMFGSCIPGQRWCLSLWCKSRGDVKADEDRWRAVYQNSVCADPTAIVLTL